MASPTAPAHKPFRPGLVAGALSVALSWGFAAALSFFGSLVFGPLAYSPVIVLASVAAVLATAWCVRGRDGGSALRPASWALVAWVPYLYGATSIDLGEPIIEGHWRCGTGLMALLFLAVVSMPFVFALGVTLTAVADRHRLTRATALAAFVGLGLALVVLGLVLRRSGKPESSGYVASVPVLRV